MLAVNEARILGYLGDNPEIHTQQQGGVVHKVARFRVATSERWTDKETGEVKERTEWHRVVAFGKPAEAAGKYLAKGSLVLASGKLHTDKWQDSAGVERYTTSIVIQNYKGLILFDKPEIQKWEETPEDGDIFSVE